MTKEEIHSIIDQHGPSGMNDVEVLNQFKTLADFQEASDYCDSKISPAYDRGNMDLGDNFAHSLMMIRQTGINNLEEHDKMKFIAGGL